MNPIFTKTVNVIGAGIATVGFIGAAWTVRDQTEQNSKDIAAQTAREDKQDEHLMRIEEKLDTLLGEWRQYKEQKR